METANIILSLNDTNDEEIPKRFKTTVLSVIKRIKVLAKGVFENENLPDPALLPITTSCHLSVFSLIKHDEPRIKVGFQEKFHDDIDLNLSLSKTGTCVLYRDIKTKNCVVRDISNATSCCGFFEWYSCYHLMPESAKIIILDLNLNIIQAFHSLVDNNARAAPIWDSKRHKFVAMFTITDFIKFLHKYYVIDQSVLENIPYNTIKDWRDMLEENPETNLIHVSPENNLRKAASVIVENNIHRLPVIDPLSRNVLAIITNSQLFRFFYERFLMKGRRNSQQSESFKQKQNVVFPKYFKNKLCDLELGNYNDAVSTIHPWQTVYDAFDIFMKTPISVLPVVDEEYRLVDIYARYDVIASVAETGQFRDLDMKISEALKMRKQVKPPCTCSKNDTLATVMDIIYDAQVHRIFIVDVNNHILGVVSLTDLLSLLCKV